MTLGATPRWAPNIDDECSVFSLPGIFQVAGASWDLEKETRAGAILQTKIMGRLVDARE
jgi:hypothetical protein